MKKILLFMFACIGLHATAFNLQSSYNVVSTWPGGYQIEVALKNTSQADTTSWSATFSLPAGQTISSLWNANFTASGQTISVTNPSWFGGGVIKAGASWTFGVVINNPQNTANGLIGLAAVGNGTAVLPVPTAPKLNAITASSNNYQVSWNSVANAASYSLQQSTNTSFTNPTTVQQGASLSHSFTNQPNGTYYYRVNASNSSGISPWSNIQTVTINIPITLAAPVLSAISNPSKSGNYTVSWSSVTNAQNYTLQVSSSSGFTSPQTVATTTSTSFNVTNQAQGTYYYRVIANASGVTSNPSNVQSTTVVNATANCHLDAYWESWNSADPLSAIAAMKFDTVSISFGTFQSTGNNTFIVTGLDCSQANLTQFVNLVHAAGKKVKISIGGASYPISSYLTTTAAAAGCAHAIANFVVANSLDGVDLDIEDYPAASNQIALIQNLRSLLPNADISYTPGTPAMQIQAFHDVIIGSHQYLTKISFMAYDYGSGYNYTQDVQAMLTAGIPSTKIMIGLMPGKDDLGALTSLSNISSAASYCVTNKLAGLMFWDLNRDYENTTGLGNSAATNTAYPILHGTAP